MSLWRYRTLGQYRVLTVFVPGREPSGRPCASGGRSRRLPEGLLGGKEQAQAAILGSKVLANERGLEKPTRALGERTLRLKPPPSDADTLVAAATRPIKSGSPAKWTGE
jgi:hypothetical protein